MAEEMLKADGYDDCVWGICERNGETFVIYDKPRILLKLMKNDGMTHAEAEEFFYFNIAGSFFESGPGYATEFTLEEIQETYEW
jgi:hypothetical protein